MEVSQEQSVSDLRDVAGTLVAVRCPGYIKGINMAGWHMHFISQDRRRGGHVLALQLDRGQARIAHLQAFEMVLPRKGRLAGVDLARTSAADVEKVEEGPQ